MSNRNCEILFRGKRTDNGEWIKGFYVIIAGENHCIFTGRIDLTQGGIGYEYFKVDPKTISQYTGLTDKNGTKIFEGDIIKTKKYGKIVGHSNVNSYDIFTVEYAPAVFRLINHSRGFNLVGNGTDYEVIGNIHDNPDILKSPENL